MTTDANGASMGDEYRSRVLVTGGSGFIGRRLVRALVRSGAEVTVADLRAFPDDTVRSVAGDLRDPSVVEAAVSQGTEVIIHLAAVTRVLLSIEDPAGTHALNVDATAGLLEQARLKGVGSFVLASTNAVTGDVGRATITEQIPLRPLTPYGATKAAGEMLLGSYAACYGIRSEEHTSELQSPVHLVCRLLLEKTKPTEIRPCRSADNRAATTIAERSATS